jgi:hypothetical protein
MMRSSIAVGSFGEAPAGVESSKPKVSPPKVSAPTRAVLAVLIIVDPLLCVALDRRRRLQPL